LTNHAIAVAVATLPIGFLSVPLCSRGFLSHLYQLPMLFADSKCLMMALLDKTMAVQGIVLLPQNSPYSTDSTPN